MDQDIISGMKKKKITKVTEANEFSQHTFKNTLCYIQNLWEIILKPISLSSKGM